MYLQDYQLIILYTIAIRKNNYFILFTQLLGGTRLPLVSTLPSNHT